MGNGGMNRHMLFFGFGFSARALARQLDRTEWKISGTSRTADGIADIEASDVHGIEFNALSSIPDDVTHIVSSVPPGEQGDPVLNRFGSELARRANQFQWVGYLSTTGVYGDHGGAWVDEATALTPNTERGARRLAAEQQWLALHRDHGLPVHVFRLAGIYGPGRNTLDNLRDGTARRVVKPGQVFSRIHVEDIAGVLLASMARPNPSRAYNVADDEPCPPQDLVTFAAELLGMAPPPEIPFADARLSPMARSFFADSKRVSNVRVKSELGYNLHYPTYREGLKSLI
jgi:nucleoside-diphosphate-sugar epimerase